MYFGQFKKSLKTGIVESIRCYGSLVEEASDGTIFIDNKETVFESLEEARIYIKQKEYSDNLEQQITKDIYEEITDTRIAKIIKEHHDIKVTDTLIESYIELASSNIFTVDPVVQKIRSLNKLDVVVEGKIHYELNDGTTIAINEDTQAKLNNLLANQKEIIEYMREGKKNFFHVLERIEE